MIHLHLQTKQSKFLPLFTVLLIITSLLTTTSCGKDGDLGPEGPQGEQGIAGDQGVQGKDGSIIYNGTTEPELSLGEVGDFYLNKSNTNLYGPKTAESWGEPLNLKGAKGDDGTAGAKGDKGETGDKGDPGTQIYSGSIAPSNALGALGDYYIDIVQMTLYGPKLGSNWGAPVSFQTPNANGVKVVIINNFQSNGEIVLDRDFDSDEFTGGISIYTPVIPTIDYHDYYENGAVLAYVRDHNDPNGYWKSTIYRTEELEDNVFWYRGSVDAQSFQHGQNNILIETDLYTSESDPNNSDQDQLHNIFTPYIADFTFDIKFVLVPGQQMDMMSQQQIDTKNLNAVSAFLNIN